MRKKREGVKRDIMNQNAVREMKMRKVRMNKLK